MILPMHDIQTSLRKRLDGILLFCVVLAVSYIGYLLIRHTDIIGDEWAHLKEAQDIYGVITVGGSFKPVHPAIPGYHLLLALFSVAFKNTTLSFYRGISIIFSALSVLAFFSTARKLDRPVFSLLKSLQYLFLPILFPFYFLLYTDVMSVLALLVCLHETFEKRYTTAGIFAILSVAIRQNNILWVICFMIFVLAQESRPFSWNAIKMYVSDLALHLLAILGLGIFILWNHGIALADVGAHPPFNFHTGNLFSFCLFFLLMFAPLLVMQPRLAWRKISSYGSILAPLLILFLFVYMLMYVNTHSYNFDQWWLRNKALAFFLSSSWSKSGYFIIVLLSCLIWAVTSLHRGMFMWMYPFSVLYLSSSWLIEPRYFLPPIVFFLLLRRPASLRIEATMLVVFILEAGILFYGAWHHSFLP